MEDKYLVVIFQYLHSKRFVSYASVGTTILMCKTCKIFYLPTYVQSCVWSYQIPDTTIKICMLMNFVKLLLLNALVHFDSRSRHY